MSEFGSEYHKINSVFKRDAQNRFIMGDWAAPEFDYLKDCPWRWTEKIDGTNIRVHWKDGRVRIGGRTDSAQIPTSLLAALNRLDADALGEVFGDNSATIFGEGYGAKIQKGGGDYRQDQGLIVFDVRVGDWWLQPENVLDVATRLGLPVAPELGVFTLNEAVVKIAALDVTSVVAKTGRLAEGIVGTPTTDLFNRRGERIVVKVKARDFQPSRIAEPVGSVAR